MATTGEDVNKSINQPAWEGGEITPVLPSAGLDNRRMDITFKFGEKDAEGNEVFTIFDESFTIKVNIKKDSLLKIGTSATVEIFNLLPDTRNWILGAFNAFRARKRATPFVPITIEIGRQSDTNLRRVFIGAVITAEATMPPDIGIRFICAESQNDKTKLIGYNTEDAMPTFTEYRDFARWCAKQLQLTLVYEAQDRKIVDPPVPFTVEGLVGNLQLYYNTDISVYIDDIYLYVKDINKALNGPIVVLSAENGLIGIPSQGGWGVTFQCLADTPIKLGGGVRLTSVRNPNTSGDYTCGSITYDLETRGNNWSSSVFAFPPGGD